jgi:threonine dehydratase
LVKPPVFADIEAAARRIAGEAVRTPVLESQRLNEIAGGRLLVKAECLQRTGSFKFRGAWNMISQLDSEKTPGGVVAFSSGNHAQGVAAAAALRGLRALIVMPSDAPATKIARTKSHGAEVVTYDRATEDRAAIARRISTERGAVLVPPYDHPAIIAGQGTCGLELAEQAKERGVDFAHVLVPASGGGLTAGIALAFETLSPKTRVHTVEPENFDDYRRSLAGGRRERNASGTGSISDALLVEEPGELTFAINQPRLGPGFAVSDGEAMAAMRFGFDELKIVLEPGGAVALAAVLSGKIDAKDGQLGVIASGGNADAAVFARALGA